MNKLVLLLVAFFFLYFSAISAQTQSALGFKADAGLGLARFTDSGILRAGQDYGKVWNMAFQVNHWWDLNPRWSIGSGLGVQLNYFHLRSRKSLETVSSLTNVGLSNGEDTLGLRRAEQAITSALANVWGEYSISRGRAHDFRLTGGVLVQRPIITNVNTVYQERVGPFPYLFSLGTAGRVDSTISESEINDYFRNQVPDWQVNLRIGIVFYYSSSRKPQNQFYVIFEYDHGLSPMMQGLSGPVRALRMGMGGRFLR